MPDEEVADKIKLEIIGFTKSSKRGRKIVLFNDDRYSLYNKDNRIIDFHCDRNDLNEPVFIVDEIYSDKQPYNFRDPNFWIGNRRAPSNRAHIDEILSKCGCKDLEGFIRFTYGASLNDTFWIKPFDKDISWENVSLYRNRFDENIAKIAFDGGLMGEVISSPSPEPITDGAVPKCWKRFGDDIYLLKRGNRLSKDQEIYGYGPQSEKYTYELAKHVCQNPLEYDLMKYHGKTACRCKCFCSEDVSYVPAAYILGERANLSQCLEYFDSIGSGEEFREMMVLDSLSFNEDRHPKNYGVLYEADTMKVIGMAPVFDNNLALFPNNSIEEMRDLDRFLKNRTSFLDIDFVDLAHKCMTPSIKKKLINLQGFKFERGGDLALDDERLDILDKIIERQIDYAIDKKVYAVDKEDDQIYADSIYMTFSKDRLPKDAYDLIVKKGFTIPDFDVITEANDRLHISDCKYDVYEHAGKAELDIYETKLSGKSSSLVVKAFSGFSLISNDLTKEIVLKPDDCDIQLRCSGTVEQSSPNTPDIVVCNTKKVNSKNSARINAFVAKGEALERAAKQQMNSFGKDITDW